MSEHLFLYGTLLPELAPLRLRRARKRLHPVGEAFVHGRLYDLGEFPGAILDATSESRIRGEVFRLPDDSMLRLLDSYEEFDPADPERSLFIRTKTSATTRAGSQVDCWIYVYNRDPANARLLPGGDYIQFVATRRRSNF